MISKPPASPATSPARSRNSSHWPVKYRGTRLVASSNVSQFLLPVLLASIEAGGAERERFGVPILVVGVRCLIVVSAQRRIAEPVVECELKGAGHKCPRLLFSTECIEKHGFRVQRLRQLFWQVEPFSKVESELDPISGTLAFSHEVQNTTELRRKRGDIRVSFFT